MDAGFGKLLSTSIHVCLKWAKVIENIYPIVLVFVQQNDRIIWKINGIASQALHGLYREARCCSVLQYKNQKRCCESVGHKLQSIFGHQNCCSAMWDYPLPKKYCNAECCNFPCHNIRLCQLKVPFCWIMKYRFPFSRFWRSHNFNG